MPKSLPLSELERKKRILAALKKKEELQEGLPFLYGWKWYEWAKDFYDSTNKVNLLCAANQISKSSTQIRKCIDWATNVEKWPSLWNKRPRQFWYLYPSGDQVDIEFDTKWLEFLPAGKYKNHPQYGWKKVIKQKKLFAIQFNSGVNVYFKTYAQNVHHLQTGTVDAIFCDEELPEFLYDELIFRISASSGYFHMVFTATMGQDFWRRAMEPNKNEKENFPGAWKRTVSMHECQKYMDGTPSHWTTEKIQEVTNKCSTQNEILKRIFGKFVMDAGRKYPSFDMKRHIKPWHHIPPTWNVYEAVDVGSGGKKGHPAAIVFVAVDPTFRQGRVFLSWRGDGIETTAGDILTQHLKMKKDNKLSPVEQRYDWASKDFYTVASRVGEAFMPADKSKDLGDQIVNTLFKNDMLFLYDTPDNQKMAGELSTLLVNTDKSKAKDDLADGLRYCVATIPWDWTVITGAKLVMPDVELKLTGAQLRAKERKDQFIEYRRQKTEEDDMNAEFDEWNELYG